MEEVEQSTQTEQQNNSLQEAAFGDGVAQAPTPNTEAAVADTQATTTTVEEEEIIDYKDWLKREFETDDVDFLKNERKELKELREKTTKPIEFKNDDSRKAYDYLKEDKLDDLYNILDQRKKIDKLSTADLSDKKIAAELVKFGIQKDNPTLNPDEVEFLFNEKYATPEKPIKGELDDDEEYQAKLNGWQNQVNNIEKRLVIEAKMNQPKIAQLKSELILPDISKATNEPTVSQEDLDAINKYKGAFTQSAEQTINSFNGFSAQVKDKDVDYSVSYVPSQEEKSLVNGLVKTFTESNFDANTLFADRWLSEDGKNIKVDQMVEDLSRIYGGEKVTQKLVTDAVNKRLEAFLGEKKQISFNGVDNGSTFSPSNQQTYMDGVREQAFS